VGEGQEREGARTAGRIGLVPFIAREVTSRAHLPISAGGGGCTAQSAGVPFHAGRTRRGAEVCAGSNQHQHTMALTRRSLSSQNETDMPSGAISFSGIQGFGAILWWFGMYDSPGGLASRPGSRGAGGAVRWRFVLRCRVEGADATRNIHSVSPHKLQISHNQTMQIAPLSSRQTLSASPPCSAPPFLPACSPQPHPGTQTVTLKYRSTCRTPAARGRMTR